MSKIKEKPFNINQLCDEVSLLTGDYTVGYLIASSSLGLFSRTNYSKKWVIVEYNGILMNKIENEVENRIKNNPKELEYLKSQKKAIEEFFA